MRSSPPPRVALLALSLGVLLAVPRPAAAQGAAALEQAEARLAAGDAAEARRLVNAWWQAAGEGGGGSERSRGLALRARLAVDSEAAERDWLAIILGYPAAREAPSALLHMGQLLLGRGEAERSSAYLSRLVMDYPGHALRPDAFLWLARARRVAGHAEGACLAVAEGLAAAPDAELRALLGVEEARCPDGLRATVRVPAGEARPPARPSAPAAGAEAGDWAIQAGAYRSAASASTLVRRLEAAGFQPRLVSVPGSQLVRVRVGRFGSAAGASALRARLAAAGFEAVVVGDAGRERPAR
ncbi:MAG TPA: SPOR domain-containing protein [Longimicrobiales bacterium]|nr:SPOR domain-containing protein [Longimicrobiales bacterium]